MTTYLDREGSEITEGAALALPQGFTLLARQREYRCSPDEIGWAVVKVKDGALFPMGSVERSGGMFRATAASHHEPRVKFVDAVVDLDTPFV